MYTLSLRFITEGEWHTHELYYTNKKRHSTNESTPFTCYNIAEHIEHVWEVIA